MPPKRRLAILLAGLALLGASPPPASIRGLEWGYPYADQADEIDVFPHRPTYTASGSRKRLTEAQLDDPFDAVDWLPAAHPPLPDVVLHGHKPGVIACGLCHMVDGQGSHGNVNLAGLPRAYIVRQIADFRAGRRVSADPRPPGPGEMREIARHASDAEIAAAADYFSRLRYRPWFRVVETPTVPATAYAYYGWTDVRPRNRREPTGPRILEIAEDRLRSGMYDPASGFIAYVPPGSIARGTALAATGGGRTMPCASCHGAGLKGMADSPPLAGRSPIYLARQLWDMRVDTRHGILAARMKPVVQRLTQADIVDLTAYLASLKP